MITGWEHVDWHTRGWYHAVLRFLMAYSVLLISRTLKVLFQSTRTLKVLFQSSFIEKEARVTNAVVYFPGFIPFGVMLLGTLVVRWCLEPACRLVDQLAFIPRGRPSHTFCRDYRFLGARSFAKSFPWKSWPLSFDMLAMEARVGPNTQDRAEHLTAATGYLFEEVMATRHPPGIAGDVAETSNTQCAFRQKS